MKWDSILWNNFCLSFSSFLQPKPNISTLCQHGRHTEKPPLIQVYSMNYTDKYTCTKLTGILQWFIKAWSCNNYWCSTQYVSSIWEKDQICSICSREVAGMSEWCMVVIYHFTKILHKEDQLYTCWCLYQLLGENNTNNQLVAPLTLPDCAYTTISQLPFIHCLSVIKAVDYVQN